MKTSAHLTTHILQRMLRNAHIMLMSGQPIPTDELVLTTKLLEYNDHSAYLDEDADCKMTKKFTNSCKDLWGLVNKATLTKSNINDNSFIAFMLTLLAIISIDNIDIHQLFNTDETPVWFTTFIEATLTPKNIANRKISRSSKEKCRFSVILMVNMAGRKIIPTCVFTDTSKDGPVTDNMKRIQFKEGQDVRNSELIPKCKITDHNGQARPQTRFEVVQEILPIDFEDILVEDTTEEELQEEAGEAAKFWAEMQDSREDIPNTEADQNSSNTTEVQTERATEQTTLGEGDGKDRIINLSKVVFDGSKVDITNAVRLDVRQEISKLVRKRFGKTRTYEHKKNGTRCINTYCIRLHDFDFLLEALEELGAQPGFAILLRLHLYLSRYSQVKHAGRDHNTVFGLTFLVHFDGLVKDQVLSDQRYNCFNNYAQFDTITDAKHEIQRYLSTGVVDRLTNRKIPKVQDPIHQAEYATQPKAWTDARVFSEAIANTFTNEGEITNQRSVVLLDNFRAHEHASLIEEINKNNGIVLFLPKNATSLLQPLDLRVNAIFKMYLRYLHIDLHNNATLCGKDGKKLFTNERQMLNVLHAWSLISRSCIYSGFKLMFSNMIEKLQTIA